ncbi:hypothetical protein ACVIKO_007788 [Rhizobium ruizarguesonis]
MPAFRARSRRLHQLPVGKPLQPHVETDIVHVSALEFGDGGAVEALEIGRPPLPAGARPALDHGKRQAFEKRVQPQAVTALHDEGVEIGRIIGVVNQAALSPDRPEIAQDPQLDLCDAGVVDEIGLAKACQLPFEFGTAGKTRQPVDRDIERVEMLAARGLIGAATVGIGEKRRVKRGEADEIGAQRSREIRHFGQILEISDAPVACRTELIKLQAHTPDARAGKEIRQK